MSSQRDDLENVPEQLRAAQEKRIEQSKVLDEVVLELLERYQKLTMKQIEEFFEKGQRKAEFKRSFLINSLKRLEDQAKIFAKTDKDAIHGKLTKYYYYSFMHENDFSELEFTQAELGSLIPDVKALLSHPTAYAITNAIIHLSSGSCSECIHDAQFSCPLIVENDPKRGTIKLRLPERFVHFYELKPGTYYFEKRFDKEKIILIKVPNLKSKEETPKGRPKNILVLEDNDGFAKSLVERLARENHQVTRVKDLRSFEKAIQDPGKKYDFVSLDDKIDDEYVARRLATRILYYQPQAKLGLLTSHDKDDLEKQAYQNLGFEYILKKRPMRRAGFGQIGDELVAYLNVI